MTPCLPSLCLLEILFPCLPRHSHCLLFSRVLVMMLSADGPISSTKKGEIEMLISSLFTNTFLVPEKERVECVFDQFSLLFLHILCPELFPIMGTFEELIYSHTIVIRARLSTRINHEIRSRRLNGWLVKSSVFCLLVRLI
ncbi:hypothetical protein KEM48_005206 [Puccinia striiformis f. sp. tritici PST-130]|nr:hypothetical protein KEM48_005206 [Puccinia striiformis f. sp. tritici PST-130]